MPYVNDPAESLRIVRQSLISSATRLMQNVDETTPEQILEIARKWEVYVYEGQDIPTTPANGTAQAPAPERVPSPVPQDVCAECGNPLTVVSFKTGAMWSQADLAEKSLTKYGRLLCKAHYFAKKS